MPTFNLPKLVKHIGGAIGKQSPIILTGMGIIGVFTTAGAAIRATPEALRIVDAENMKRMEDLAPPVSRIEVIKLTWKCYIPACTSCLVTVACIAGATSIHSKRNAALAALYSISETTLKEYQNKVVETIGKNKARAISDEVAQDRLYENPVDNKEVIITSKGDMLCYDVLSGRYFKSDIEALRRIRNELNDALLKDDWVSVNDLYYEIGLDSIKLGNNIGWTIDNRVDFKFTSKLATDGQPCLVVDYFAEPKYSK